jgi:hypothetical protein
MATFKKTDVTKTLHKVPYAAISPLRPELSQKGRVVYVTGGSAGIGLAICHAFAQAGAAVVIVTARREGLLNETVASLTKEHPKTKFVGQVLDASDRPATEKAWAQLDSDGVVVDVLVLNAAHVQTKQATMLELGYEEAWPSFVTNVGANLDLIDRFYHQKKRAAGQKLVSCTRFRMNSINVYSAFVLIWRCTVADQYFNPGYSRFRSRQHLPQLLRFEECGNAYGAASRPRSFLR